PLTTPRSPARRHHLGIVARRPPEQREEVHHCLRQQPLVLIVANGGCSVTLRQFLPVRAVNHWHVCKLRYGCAKSAIQQDLLWRVGNVVIPTHHHRDAHGNVVGHYRHVVHRCVVRTQNRSEEHTSELQSREN